MEEINGVLASRKKNWNWFDWIQHWWYIYFWNWFSAIPRNIVWFLQRGIRGWSDNDLWGMHCYTTDVILNMLVELRRVKHGYPATKDEKGIIDYDDERWLKILDEMIDGFAILKKVDNELMEYAPNANDEDRAKMEKGMREKFPEWRFTTREEEAKVKKAFQLFYEHYTSLWD